MPGSDCSAHVVKLDHLTKKLVTNDTQFVDIYSLEISKDI